MATDVAITVVTGGAGKVFNKVASKVSQHLDDVMDIKISHLDGTETTLDEVRNNISTAKSYQSKEPRTLHEQLTIEEVKANPEIGEVITDGKGNSLNNDPLFHEQDGFIKKSHKHQLPDGEKIDIHYQYHPESGNVYDIKVNSPRRNPIQPGASIKEAK